MVEEQAQGSPLIDAQTAQAVTQTVQPTVKPGKPTAADLGPKEYCWGTGRRKAAVARVRLRPGSGKISVNGRELDNYFPNLRDRNDVRAPLEATDSGSRFDIWINVAGGGLTGQAGACVLGIARALIQADPTTFATVRERGFLTRDSRQVERKKYGQRGARRSFQFSKR